jgi:hypothetical protein
MTGTEQRSTKSDAPAASIGRPLTIPAVTWIGSCVLGIAAIWEGLILGLWFIPFIVSVLVGITARWKGGRAMPALALACLMGLGGWALPLVYLANEGRPVGATASIAAALAGLPSLPAIVLGATLLVPVLQACAGLWLGWSVTRLAVRRRSG